MLGTPAPKVYTWDSCATNPVGVEYIIMEKMPGIQLRQVWSHMKLVEKMNLCLDLARYQSAWLSVTFSQFGGLYYTQDVRDLNPGQKTHLYIDEKGKKVQNSRFTVGPISSREWFDCGRAGLECDRGPCKHACYNLLNRHTFCAHKCCREVCSRLLQSNRASGKVGYFNFGHFAKTESYGMWPWPLPTR